ncbi:uncharacterized protein LOC134834534 isoform X2 [Culicoides brevitarsis]|uniref:uncharacterized protein LOC134834534 isoform X2 n=1 Tax=Culicoides brevitarsis TaxID=469753 RepID=UPI00307C2E0E
MKYTFLAHTIAFVLLSTIVTFTHCCSSRRMPQRRPPSSSTIIRTHDPRILNHPRGEEDVLSSSKSARLPNSSSKTTPSVTFTDKQLPSVHKILPSSSSSSSSARPSVAPGVASVTTSSSTSSSSTTTSTSSTNDNINSSRPSGASTITLNDSNCTSAYRKHYCLNNGICFNYTIQQNFTLLSCLCADGFYGERCEDKYLEGSYSTRRAKVAQERFFQFRNSQK